jgi:hypothetical protein
VDALGRGENGRKEAEMRRELKQKALENVKWNPLLFISKTPGHTPSRVVEIRGDIFTGGR